MTGIILFLALLFGLTGNALASESLALKVDGGELHGTLEVAQNIHASPIALIISGSGPTDRDGNSALVGKNNSLKMLAKGLADQGIASLRYDKRGIAASAAAGRNEADLRFDTYIDDAMSWGRLLSKNRRFSQLIVIGHSEGALIGAVACRRLGARGFISIAGAGYPASEVLANQLQKTLPPDLLSESRRILGLLKSGKTSGQVPAPLMILFRSSVQPYLISWFRYDPADEVSKIKAPCLIAQGTSDIQVSVSDARRLAESTNRARLLLIQGMNHVLKMVPRDPVLQMKSYGDPNLPISEELVDNAAAFIKEVGP